MTLTTAAEAVTVTASTPERAVNLAFDQNQWPGRMFSWVLEPGELLWKAYWTKFATQRYHDRVTADPGVVVSQPLTKENEGDS